MTGIWAAGAFLAGAAFGWRMALLACTLAVIIWLVRRSPAELLVVAIVCGAAALGAVRSSPAAPPPSPAWLDTAAGLRGMVDSAPTSTGRSQSFRLRVSDVAIDETWRPSTGVICVAAAPLPRLGLGDRLTLFGQPEPLADQARATRSYLAGRGCDGTMFARAVEIDAPGGGWRRRLADVRASLGAVLATAAPGDSGALLGGLVTGDDRALTTGSQDAFLRTGTTHITAVSGSNVALVVAILATIGGAGGWRRHLLWQLAVVAAIWLYAILVGGEPPVVRAALVASAAVLAVRFGRRPDFVTLIFLAAMAMVLIEPGQIRSLSFQLSFAASLGIVLVMTGLTIDGFLGGLAAAARASIAAQVATLPVIWVVIGQLSLTSLLANLLIAPAIALAFPLAALAGVAGLLWQPLANVLALPALLCARLVFAVVDFLGSQWFAMATVGESSPVTALLITGVAVLAILLLSPDAQAWFGRTSRQLGLRSGAGPDLTSVPALAAGGERWPMSPRATALSPARSPVTIRDETARQAALHADGATSRAVAAAFPQEPSRMCTPERIDQEVRLREVVDGDLPIFFEHQREPEANWTAAFTPPNPDDMAAFSARWSRFRADPTILIRTIVAGDLVAGSVSSFEKMGEREVSYWIGRELWGRGIASKALAAFLEVERTRPIHARAAKDNAGSLKVLQRCGFVITGEDRGFANARGSEVEEYLLIRRD